MQVGVWKGVGMEVGVWRNVGTGVEVCRCGGMQVGGVWKDTGMAGKCRGVQVWNIYTCIWKCGGMQVWRDAGVEGCRVKVEV